MVRLSKPRGPRRLLLVIFGGLALVLSSLVAVNASAATAPARVAVPAECQHDPRYISNGTSTRTGFPRNPTTGPQVGGQNETTLKASGRSGRWVISESGAVISGVFHAGTIDVRADNVTIRNSVICGRGHHIVQSHGRNLTIENSIVRGERGEDGDGQPCASAVKGGNYTILRSELTHCTDLFKVGGTVEVRDSWMHDAWTHRLPDGMGTHNDTVQKNNGVDLDTLVFDGNSAYGDPCVSNRHFQIGTGDAVGKVVIKNNFFYGLTGIVNVAPSYDGEITSNTLAGSRTEGPFSDFDTGHMAPGLWTGNHHGISKSGNVFEHGQAVPENGKADPYVCTP